MTELTRLSAISKLTARAEFVYMGIESVRSLLSHNKYKETLQELIDRKVVKRVEKRSVFDKLIFAFEPVFYIPTKKDVKIRNLKVRNAVRNYLDISPPTLNQSVKKYLSPGLLKTEILISETEFFDNLDEKYNRYIKRKSNRYEKPSSPERYREDLTEIYFSVLKYQNTPAERRADYLTEDKFSGRVYNIATGVPKWLRYHFKINGESLVEYDMQSSHAILLWKIVPRTDYVKFLYETTSRGLDIYSEYGRLIGKTDRNEVKIRFLRGLYGKLKSPYYMEFKRIFPGAGQFLDEIKTKEMRDNPSGSVKGRHTNLAYLLLNMEVKIFRKVWEGLFLQGVKFLTIHDGILVPLSQQRAARNTITEILKKEIPIIEIDTVYY